MSVNRIHTTALVSAVACLALASVAACSATSQKAADDGKGMPESPAAAIHGQACQALLDLSVEGGEGAHVPGDAGAPRWGMPEGGAAPEVGVRRSWSTLSDAEKRQVADAFVELKKTIVGSGAPGADRAGYNSFCSHYDRNLYDFYVELHVSAFASMGTTDMSHYQMPHMGSQFLPWHRYLLLRLEADLRQASGDPGFMLPYWNWADCQGDAAPGENPCPALFEQAYLGSAGSCDQNDEVTGYLVDQGFTVNLFSESTIFNTYNASSITCSGKTFQRNAGCSKFLNDGKPGSAADMEAVYERPLYDAEPYDACNTEEDVSMRQYVEGYTNTDLNPLCVLAGCRMHGLGHIYVGGDMAASTAPNDPVFFLHHANVDRLWAMWQERNLADADTAVDHGNPGFPDDWRGALFNFSEVRADEMFDHRALGFRYDTNRAE